MDRTEIENLIDQKVDTVVSRQFGMVMEWFTDQFALVHEKFEMLEEKMDRGFAEIREDIAQIKINVDRNSLDILELQNKDKESWRRYKKY